MKEYTIGTKVFNDWEITRKLGEGSYGKVFEISKSNFGITAKSALKVIRIPRSASDVKEALSDGMDEKTVTGYFRDIVERLVREIAVMADLKSHPGIVAYEDHLVEVHEGTVGWDILIRMELLTSLTDYQLSHPLSEADVVRLGVELSDALVFCSKKALVHRDIKPANIFISETGRFKLGDFGVARTAEKTMGDMSRQGTENYMAPEVYLKRPYGPNVDIYSLGLVLYRLMNGNRLPFLPPAPEKIGFDDKEHALTRRMAGEALPPPLHASEAFAAVILKACAFDPKARYHTAAELLAALKELEHQMLAAEQARPAETPEADEDDGSVSPFRNTANYETDDEDDDDGSVGPFKNAGPKKTVAGEVDADSDSNLDGEDDGTVSPFGGKQSGQAQTREAEKPQEQPSPKKETREEPKPTPRPTPAPIPAGKKKKPWIPLAAGAAAVAVIAAIMIPKGQSTPASAENVEETVAAKPDDVIRIGVFTADKKDAMSFDYLAEQHPELMIEGKNYRVELVHGPVLEPGVLVGADDEKNMRGTAFDEEAVELFQEAECSVVLQRTNTEEFNSYINTAFTELMMGADIPCISAGHSYYTGETFSINHLDPSDDYENMEQGRISPDAYLADFAISALGAQKILFLGNANEDVLERIDVTSGETVIETWTLHEDLQNATIEELADCMDSNNLPPSLFDAILIGNEDGPNLPGLVENLGTLGYGFVPIFGKSDQVPEFQEAGFLDYYCCTESTYVAELGADQFGADYWEWVTMDMDRMDLAYEGVEDDDEEADLALMESVHVSSDLFMTAKQALEAGGDLETALESEVFRGYSGQYSFDPDTHKAIFYSYPIYSGMQMKCVEFIVMDGLY